MPPVVASVIEANPADLLGLSIRDISIIHPVFLTLLVDRFLEECSIFDTPTSFLVLAAYKRRKSLISLYDFVCVYQGLAEADLVPSASPPLMWSVACFHDNSVIIAQMLYNVLRYLLRRNNASNTLSADSVLHWVQEATSQLTSAYTFEFPPSHNTLLEDIGLSIYHSPYRDGVSQDTNGAETERHMHVLKGYVSAGKIPALYLLEPHYARSIVSEQMGTFLVPLNTEPQRALMQDHVDVARAYSKTVQYSCSETIEAIDESVRGQDSYVLVAKPVDSANNVLDVVTTDDAALAVSEKGESSGSSFNLDNLSFCCMSDEHVRFNPVVEVDPGRYFPAGAFSEVEQLISLTDKIYDLQRSLHSQKRLVQERSDSNRALSQQVSELTKAVRSASSRSQLLAALLERKSIALEDVEGRLRQLSANALVAHSASIVTIHTRVTHSASQTLSDASLFARAVTSPVPSADKAVCTRNDHPSTDSSAHGATLLSISANITPPSCSSLRWTEDGSASAAHSGSSSSAASQKGSSRHSVRSNSSGHKQRLPGVAGIPRHILNKIIARAPPCPSGSGSASSGFRHRRFHHFAGGNE